MLTWRPSNKPAYGRVSRIASTNDTYKHRPGSGPLDTQSPQPQRSTVSLIIAKKPLCSLWE